MTGIETVNLLLSITNKFMDHIPNYSQRRKNEYRKKLDHYRREVNLGLDDNLIDNLQEELLDFIRVFEKELKK